MGIECRVLMTRMTAPIGHSVGNSLEIIESVDCLKGNGAGDLQTLVESIGNRRCFAVAVTVNDCRGVRYRRTFTGDDGESEIGGGRPTSRGQVFERWYRPGEI